MTKTLYVYEYSVWAAVTDLSVAELGCKEGDVATKAVNLVQGENEPLLSSSWYAAIPTPPPPPLAITPLTHTRAEPERGVYTSTREIVVKDAPSKVAAGTTIIAAIHDPQYDPNFAVFFVRDDAELAAKSTGFPKTFIATR
ncbi:hypothetical protein DFH09DRAFT_1310084 [Mycena vulgaris]|nr:hypothetical protein DFH09DRAFT_1310084 [Mycena vulgaris]